MVHKLKLNADYYDDSASGKKTFEIRKNDRDYKVGDFLELREWVFSVLENKGSYTGNVHWKIITYVFNDEQYLPEGYVCLACYPTNEPVEVKDEKES